MLITGAAVTGCGDGSEKQEAAIIGKSQIKIEGRRMTPEALWAMGRIGEVCVSPDAATVIYGVATIAWSRTRATTHCTQWAQTAATSDCSPPQQPTRQEQRG